MNHKLAKILLALGIGLSLVSCTKKPEEPRSSQVKKEEKVTIGEMTGVAQMNGYFIKMTMPDLLSVYTPKQEGCFLIVSPGSVLYNWRDELDTWGYFKVRLYHGSSKEGVLEYAAKGKLDIVLTTYETLKINLVSYKTNMLFRS